MSHLAIRDSWDPGRENGLKIPAHVCSKESDACLNIILIVMFAVCCIDMF